MSLKHKIKAILQEAEIYRTQGLLTEAIEKYRAASDLIQKNTHLKNRGRLLSVIDSKLMDIEGGEHKKNGDTPSPQLSNKAQNLIKKLFSFSDSKNEDEAALDGALALAKFGQIDRALSELNILIKKDSLKIVAAKNIIRCHLSVGSPDSAIVQFQQWVESDEFSFDQLTTIRSYLSVSLENKGIDADLPELSPPPSVDGGQGMDDDDFMDDDDQDSGFLDITSIGITFEQGPQKGKMVEFDVNFQSGNLLSLIIPDKDKVMVETLEDGVRLNNIQFFSPLAIFKGSGIVSSRTMIKNGPKKGDICLDIKILNQ